MVMASGPHTNEGAVCEAPRVIPPEQ
jgi:hypothetical protein